MGIPLFPPPPFFPAPAGVDLGTVTVMPTGSNVIYLRSTGPQSADPAALSMLIDHLGPWLAAEYTAAHGEKAPRP